MRGLIQYLAIVLVLLPAIANAGPIKLKLAFFSSDRTQIYRAGVKPFVDAVNAAGRGRVEIDVNLSGSLGQYPIKQSQLLRDGRADIAYIVQPYEQSIFPDSRVVELPGLYKNGREATLVFSYLARTGLMRGFGDFVVLGAFASEPESLHFRPAVRSLSDLRGKRVRANNETEIAIFKHLGIKPVFVPLPDTANAISSGKIDGAAVPPVPMIEFGIGRVTTHHYMLATSCVPLSLLMSRKRFNGLPSDVQRIIRKFSGKWLEDAYIRVNESSTALIMNQLESEPRRSVVFPSTADKKKAEAIFQAIDQAYATSSPHNAELFNAALAEVTEIRKGK